MAINWQVSIPNASLWSEIETQLTVCVHPIMHERQFFIEAESANTS